MFQSHQTGYQAPAVKKAFDLLMLVAESQEEFGLSEMARILGYSKSTTHGLVQSLLHLGALELDPERKKYCLGPAVLELTFGIRNHVRIEELAQPYLDKLRDDTGETIFLGCLGRRRAIIMAASESKKPLKISASPGTTLPVMAGAVGKLLLSRFDEKAAQSIIHEQGLQQFTSASILDEEIYLSELTIVREKGYAVDNGEYLPGVRAVATDIHNRRGMSLSLWAVGFIEIMENNKWADIIEKTLRTADHLRDVFDDT